MTKTKRGKPVLFPSRDNKTFAQSEALRRERIISGGLRAEIIRLKEQIDDLTTGQGG